MINLVDNISGIIVSILTIVLIVIGFIGWFIRLEAKVMYLEKDHADHKKNWNDQIEKMSLKIDAFQITLNQVLQGVARLEGQITNKE